MAMVCGFGELTPLEQAEDAEGAEDAQQAEERGAFEQTRSTAHANRDDDLYTSESRAWLGVVEENEAPRGTRGDGRARGDG
jgi:hypothetical protein